MPTMFILTVPVVTILFVISPSILSVAVAPSSIYEELTFIVAGLLPNIVI